MLDAPALPLLDAAIRGAAIALLLLATVALPRLPVPAAAVLPIRLLALGMAVQLVANQPWLMQAMTLRAQAPLIAISVGNGALFWLVVRALFDDGFRARPIDALPWASAAAASVSACLLPPSPWPSAWALAAGIQKAAPLVFALLALAAALRQWDADLVEARRRLRAFLVVSGIAYSLAMIVVRLLGGPRLGTGSALGEALAVLAMVAPLMAWAVTRGPGRVEPAAAHRPVGAPQASTPGEPQASHGPGDADGPTDARPTRDRADPADAPGTAPGTAVASDRITGSGLAPAAAAAREAAGLPASPDPGVEGADPVDDRLADALARAMDVEQAWRDEGLTIGRLADRLGAPEYRLRRVINRRLGHRNFNAFVNGYRLDAACRALADPARRDEPVLSIALDAGFQSIGPFNRAFRQATGVTPTEYRRAHGS